MIERGGFYWVLFPYLVVFAGIALFQNAWGALVGFHLSLLPVILPHWRKILTVLRAPVPRMWLWGVGIPGLLAGIGLWAVWNYLGISETFSRKIFLLGLSQEVWIPFIIYFLLVNPFLEEAYWRIVLGGTSKNLVLSDLLFSGYHIIILFQFVTIPWMFSSFIVLALASWFWRLIFARTGSILPAVLSHFFADFSLLMVIYHYSH